MTKVSQQTEKFFKSLSFIHAMEQNEEEEMVTQIDMIDMIDMIREEGLRQYRSAPLSTQRGPGWKTRTHITVSPP